jgi:hypothetical protein
MTVHFAGQPVHYVIKPTINILDVDTNLRPINVDVTF